MGDWPAFLVKYRLISANKDNGDYIVTAFFQMSDPAGHAAGQISNNVLTAQPTLAFGKGLGRFRYSVDGQRANSGRRDRSSKLHGPAEHDEISAIRYFGILPFSIISCEYFWPELEVNYTYWPNGIHARSEPGPAHAGHHLRALQDRPRTPRPGRST